MMAKESGSDERTKASPDAEDLENPKEVWEDEATVPSPTVGEPETGPLGRVADAGTLGAGNISPYGIEIQAEIIAGQTMRPESPARRRPARERAASPQLKDLTRPHTRG